MGTIIIPKYEMREVLWTNYTALMMMSAPLAGVMRMAGIEPVSSAWKADVLTN